MNRAACSYARARLLLGIGGVGSLVLISLGMIVMGLPQRLLPTAQEWSWRDPLSLAAFIAVYIGCMLPLDWLGGWYLPRRYGRTAISPSTYVRQWAGGVALQALVFLAAGLLLLAAGRLAGLPAVAVSLLLMMLACLYLQQRVATTHKAELSGELQRKLAAAIEQQTACAGPPLAVVSKPSHDRGFTGGVVGLPGRELLILPVHWIEQLSVDELAAAIGRRGIAIRSGSRTRGIVLASAWVLGGFIFSAWCLDVTIASVAELVSVIAGATLFTFLGLLLLPLVSRRASYQIDHQLIARGVDPTVLNRMLEKMDRWQDDEPDRSPLIESIFHPVPSLANRKSATAAAARFPTAWHAARMTVFLSWAGMGLLSRAVHCNVGRPNLWLLLPTD